MFSEDRYHNMSCQKRIYANRLHLWRHHDISFSSGNKLYNAAVFSVLLWYVTTLYHGCLAAIPVKRCNLECASPNMFGQGSTWYACLASGCWRETGRASGGRFCSSIQALPSITVLRHSIFVPKVSTPHVTKNHQRTTIAILLWIPQRRTSICTPDDTYIQLLSDWSSEMWVRRCRQFFELIYVCKSCPLNSPHVLTQLSMLWLFAIRWPLFFIVCTILSNV